MYVRLDGIHQNFRVPAGYVAAALRAVAPVQPVGRTLHYEHIGPGLVAGGEIGLYLRLRQGGDLVAQNGPLDVVASLAPAMEPDYQGIFVPAGQAVRLIGGIVQGQGLRLAGQGVFIVAGVAVPQGEAFQLRADAVVDAVVVKLNCEIAAGGPDGEARLHHILVRPDAVFRGHIRLKGGAGGVEVRHHLHRHIAGGAGYGISQLVGQIDVRDLPHEVGGGDGCALCINAVNLLVKGEYDPVYARPPLEATHHNGARQSVGRAGPIAVRRDGDLRGLRDLRAADSRKQKKGQQYTDDAGLFHKRLLQIQGRFKG